MIDARWLGKTEFSDSCVCRYSRSCSHHRLQQENAHWGSQTRAEWTPTGTCSDLKRNDMRSLLACCLLWWNLPSPRWSRLGLGASQLLCTHPDCQYLHSQSSHTCSHG